MRKLSIIIPTLCLVALAVALVVRPGTTQPAPGKLVIGIYAPSVEFGTVQGLAKAIEAQTGVKTEAKSFASFGALKSAGVDFAIVDAQCYATNLGWNLLANAQIGGSGARTYALFSGAGGDMKALEGKKLAFVQTGCNDNGFVDNAMLESEVDAGFFASRVGKPDLTAAVAEVASYKGAQAVFAPIGSQKGLAKLFDTGAVPNPAFLQVNAKVPAATVAREGRLPGPRRAHGPRRQARRLRQPRAGALRRQGRADRAGVARRGGADRGPPALREVARADGVRRWRRRTCGGPSRSRCRGASANALA